MTSPSPPDGPPAVCDDGLVELVSTVHTSSRNNTWTRHLEQCAQCRQAHANAQQRIRTSGDAS